MNDQLDLNPVEAQAVVVLWALWRGVPSDFKQQYARTIYDIFKSRVEAAANQNGTLSRFMSAVAAKLGGSVGTHNPEDTQSAVSAAASPNAPAVLDEIRTNLPYLIAILRLRVQAYNAQFKSEE